MIVTIIKHLVHFCLWFL